LLKTFFCQTLDLSGEQLEIVVWLSTAKKTLTYFLWGFSSPLFINEARLFFFMPLQIDFFQGEVNFVHFVSWIRRDFVIHLLKRLIANDSTLWTDFSNKEWNFVSVIDVINKAQKCRTFWWSTPPRIFQNNYLVQFRLTHCLCKISTSFLMRVMP